MRRSGNREKEGNTLLWLIERTPRKQPENFKEATRRDLTQGDGWKELSTTGCRERKESLSRKNTRLYGGETNSSLGKSNLRKSSIGKRNRGKGRQGGLSIEESHWRRGLLT